MRIPHAGLSTFPIRGLGGTPGAPGNKAICPGQNAEKPAQGACAGFSGVASVEQVDVGQVGGGRVICGLSGGVDSAVRGYQRKAGLPVSGVVNQLTWKALQQGKV